MKGSFLLVSVLVVSSWAVYDHLPSAVLAFLAGLNVRYQHVLQSQVEALLLGIIRQEEEGSEAQRDEGAEYEEEDELLGEP